MARRKNPNPFVPLLIGGVIGSAAALVMAPATGKETRDNISNGVNRLLFKANEQKKVIINDAREFAKDMVHKAEDVYNKSVKFAEGRYQSSADSIDLEIRSIKNALDAAVTAYRDTKSMTTGSGIEETIASNEVIANEMFSDFEDETLPKQEGMGRRAE